MAQVARYRALLLFN